MCRPNFSGMGERDKLFLETLDKLKELLERRGVDTVRNVFAEVVSAEIETEYLKKHGLKRSNAVQSCTAGIIGKRHQSNAALCEYCYPPGYDHCCLLNKNGRAAELVMQPYQLTWESLRDLIPWAIKRRLRADICADHSWYYPNSTVFISLSNAEQE